METTEILKQCTVIRNVVKLPNQQLDRKDYLEVKNKLELIGGKWKSGKTQGFVFEEDPTEMLEAIANGENRNLKKEYQFFATPIEVADMIVWNCFPLVIDKNVKILEPSAGDGALIKAFRRNFSNPNHIIDCYELMDLNRMKLIKLDNVKIRGNDFIEAANKENHYDFIMANPPFTKNQDIDHIRKMYEVCKPGGTIVTLSSLSWINGSQKKQKDFKEWLQKIGAEIEEIQPGEFKESGTTVGCLMITINKAA